MAEDRGDNKGPIGKLREQLYSRSRKSEGIGRSRLRSEGHELRPDWERGEEAFRGPNVDMRRKKKKSFVNRFLVFSIIFFVAAILIAVFVIGGRANIISSRNVDISVTGPVSIGGGEVLALQIEVANKNRTELQVADLLVEFPDGTRDPADLSKELSRFRETLGDISAGDKAAKTVQAVLFGEEGSKKDIIITVEYRVPGSNAIFFKERKYELEISSSPLNVSISVPKETNAGASIPIVAEVTSNAASIVEDVLLTIEYPFGYTLESASPEPSFDENVWELGDIEPGGKRTIRISGVIDAQDEEERTFIFESGIKSERDEKKIGTPFITTLRSIVVKRPFIDLNVAIDGEIGEEHVVGSGKPVRVDISFVNNLSESIRNAAISATLSGVALDKTSVSSPNGFYRSIDNTVIWDKTLFPPLGSIAPGVSGRVNLDFRSFGLKDRVDLRNPEIFIEITITGERVGESGVPRDVISKRSRRVIVASDLGLVSRAVHFVGPFVNSGPIPPKAERETTYTVIWSVTNSSNDVARGEVRATLPSYVRWVGATSPSSENVSFNPVGGEVVWDLGDIASGVGFAGIQREVSFQVAVLPSISQIGSQPTLVNSATLSGLDRFAGVEVSASAGAVTTRLSSDPQFQFGDGVVVE